MASAVGGRSPMVIDPSRKETLGSVEEAFEVSSGSGKLWEAAAAIDRVHKTPAGMPRISFEMTASIGNPGQYVRLRDGSAVGIQVRPGEEVAVVVHEIGHFLDHKGLFGDQAVPASEHHPGFQKFQAAIEQTPTIKRFRSALETGTLELPDGSTAPVTPEMRELLEYNLRPREVFARAYEQWVLARANIPTSRHTRLEYWPEGEREALYDALEDLFRSQGLL